MALKIGTQGTLVRTEATAGGGIDTTVASIVSLTDNPQAAPDIDVTTLDSTAREFRGGLGDFGTMSGQVVHDPTDTSHQLMNTLFLNSTVQAWRIVLPTTPSAIGYFGFNGYVQLWGMPGSIGVDTVLTNNFTIRKTGAVTFTAGAEP